jgi:heavy metal sensor kinase
MRFSIRTHLTFLIAFVFLAIFAFFLITGSIALYLGLTEEMDRQLRMEARQMTDLFESGYSDLLNETPENREALRDGFIDELNEMYQHKHQFALFALTSQRGRRIYAGGKVKNIQLLLPKDFLAKKEGFYTQRFDGNYYRVLLQKKKWGTMILGIENRTIFEVADEFEEILLIGIPFMILLIFAGGRFLAGRALRPVVAAAETAEHISLSNFGHRLSDYNKKDEFGVLVKTLNNMIARLETGIKSMQQFTQDAAHELRTPLTLLRGELELLYQKNDRPVEEHIALRKSLDRTITLQKIIDDLMLLARSDSGRYPLQKKPFPLDLILKETAEDFRLLGEKRNIKVVIQRLDPAEFMGDEQLMRRLLLNLSDNALKYTSHGQITYSLALSQESVEIRIADTGIGIPDEERPYIFDRFYRVDKARSLSTGGSGLGLAISKWIAEMHDGTLRIESNSPGGTVAVLTFPGLEHFFLP